MSVSDTGEQADAPNANAINATLTNLFMCASQEEPHAAIAKLQRPALPVTHIIT